jgi:hypothetical protein
MHGAGKKPDDVYMPRALSRSIQGASKGLLEQVLGVLRPAGVARGRSSPQPHPSRRGKCADRLLQLLVRRLRIFGQRDKLKANRSKGA